MSDYIKHLITYKGCPPLTPPVTKITAAKHNLYYEPEDGTIHCATCRWSTKHISDITMATLRCPAHPLHVLGCSSSTSPTQNGERAADNAYTSRSDKAEASLQRAIVDNYNRRPVQHAYPLSKSEVGPSKLGEIHGSSRAHGTSTLYNEGEHKVANFGNRKTSPGSNSNKRLQANVKEDKRYDNFDNVKFTESLNRDLLAGDAIVESADKYSKGMSENVYSVDQVQMKKLKNRLRTFEQEGWPESCPVPYRSIAEAGFYYTGQGDMVKCAFCKKRVHQWEKEDDPVMEHCKLSPYCEYIQNMRRLIK